MPEEMHKELKRIAKRVKSQTLLLHRRAPETRIASSLSAVEILVALYYGGYLRFRADRPGWEERDRFIASKGHGSIALYPILADLGFFPADELEKIGTAGSFLGSIPDPVIPGYETVNGSLGHGPGVGIGMALAMRLKKSTGRVVVLAGDGELYEGAVWEAIMLAGHLGLNNLKLIIDYNHTCMLDRCEKVIDQAGIEQRFESFKWQARQIDGHDFTELTDGLDWLFAECAGPRVLVSETVKGKGVPELEKSSLSHILNLKPERIDQLLEGENYD